MRRRSLTFWLSGILSVTAMGAAINAPAEVLDNLDFFRDFDLLANLEILEDEPAEREGVAVSTAPAVSTAATSADISTTTAKAAVTKRRHYEKH